MRNRRTIDASGASSIDWTIEEATTMELGLSKAVIVLGGLAGLLWLAELGSARAIARAKIQHTSVNVALLAMRVLLHASLGAILIRATLWTESARFGILSRFELAGPAKWVLGFLLMDLGGYCVHRMSHSVPALWRLHRVHHTDLIVDVSTYFRTHPGEAVILWLWFVLVVVVVAPPLALVEVTTAATIVSALLQHADLRLPDVVERGLRRIWISGALHRIHHSQYQPETDSNYGSLLAFWDQLFGTYRTGFQAPMQLGLIEFAASKWQGIGGVLFTPFASVRPSAARNDELPRPSIQAE